MRLFKVPFEYWEDCYTKRIRKKLGDKLADDRKGYFLNRCVHQKDNWRFPYHLPPLGVKRLRSLGDFSGRYRDCEDLVDTNVGRDAHIFCPGPSLNKVNPANFSGELTFAINSAGFKFPAIYWCIAESSYAEWLVQQMFPWSVMLLTARAAVCIRHAEREMDKSLLPLAFILRWEEEGIIPYRAPSGATVMNALVTAWQMGCPKAYLYGLDLDKKNGPYVLGVPHTREGAKRAFDEQIRTLEQFWLPGLEIINCSPTNRVKTWTSKT
jgi:hypothetical protein